MTNRFKRWLNNRFVRIEDKSSFWYCFRKEIVYRKGTEFIAILFLSPIIGFILIIPIMIISLITGVDLFGINFENNYFLLVFFIGLLVTAIWVLGSEYRGFFIIREFSEKIIRANSNEPKLSSSKDYKKYIYELEKYYEERPLEAMTGEIEEKEIEKIKKKTIKIKIGKLIDMLKELNEKGW
jgi:hypothetical protein